MPDEEFEELQIFHDAVREYIISLLLFILLYVSSFYTISKFKKTDSEEYCAGDEDALAYRIALWLCTYTLAVSAGAVLLLPISIISNEVLLAYPNSYYVKWLNSSLIHGLWNHVFLFSNLSLFMLMSFAYFFTEAEGFSGSRKGIKARVYETLVILALLAVSVTGLVWVASALFGENLFEKQTSYDVWNIYLPYFYSFISFLGVLLLLLCTPVGFSRMFTVMGQLVIKPQFLRDIEEELATVLLTEDDLKRRLQNDHCSSIDHRVPGRIANGHANNASLKEKLQEVQRDRKELEKRRNRSSCCRNLYYPLVMLVLLGFTVLGVLMVAQNMFQLLVGIKALPVGTKETVLGITSLSALGSIGAVLEIILIFYIMSASVVGFYSLPFFGSIRPVYSETSMVHIILNCSVLLILSSALPVLSRTLGITNFDLVGNFGSMDWLGNFYIIFTYNAIFTGATVLCLVTNLTVTVRREIFLRIMSAFKREKPRSYSLNGDVRSD